jgi:hypothetical protein
MQAYQTAPCPYCGATWNPPGAQTCANCHNQLPPPQATYTPPGYAPSQGQPAAPDPSQYPDPNQGYSPPPGYPQPAQPDYGQAPPPDYGQQPQPGYPQPDYGQQPQPGYSPPQPGYGYQDPGQAYPPSAYPSYSPQPGGYPNYQPPQGYPPDASGQYAQAPAPTPAAGKTINLLGYPITIPASLLALLPTSMPALPSVALPQVRPGAIVGRLKPLLSIVGAIAVIWVFLTAVVPALATSNLQAANQAVAAAVAHQSQVDAALAQAFVPTKKDPMTDVAVAQAATDQRLSKDQAALDQVRADENAIGTLDQHLSWLSPVSGSRAGAITAARQRTGAALRALKLADQVLTGAVDQDRQLEQLFTVIVAWRTMQQDMAKHDPASATALYPDANQKLQSALQMSAGSDIPPSAVAYTKKFQAVLDDTYQLAVAQQAKDNAGIAKYTPLLLAAVRAQAYDDPATVAWNLKMFQPMIAGYDGGMRALKT